MQKTLLNLAKIIFKSFGLTIFIWLFANISSSSLFMCFRRLIGRVVVPTTVLLCDTRLLWLLSVWSQEMLRSLLEMPFRDWLFKLTWKLEGFLLLCTLRTYVRKTLADLGFPPKGPVVLAVDNQAAIKIAENVGVTGRTKHFVDAIHYFRHLVDHRVVAPTFVRTNFQRADGFTKPLAKGPFREWTNKLLWIPE